MNNKIAVFLYRIEKEDILREESRIRELLDDSRREKAAKLKNESARIQSIAAGMLLKVGTSLYLMGQADSYMYGRGDSVTFISHDELLSRFESIYRTLCDIIIEDVSNVRDMKSGTKLYYNLSHSGDYVALAVGDVPVGIDIEHKCDKSFKVTKRMFTQLDQSYIYGDKSVKEYDDEAVDLDAMEMAQRRFRDIWTIKEAFLKCLGIGISVPLSSFDASFDHTVSDREKEQMDEVILSGKIDIREDAPDKLQGASHFNFSTSRISGGDYSLTLCYRAHI